MCFACSTAKSIERLDVRRYPSEDRDATTLLTHINELFFREGSATQVVICYVEPTRSLVVLREGAEVPPHYHKNLGTHDSGAEAWEWSPHSPGPLHFAVGGSDLTEAKWAKVQTLDRSGKLETKVPGNVAHTVWAPEGGALWVMGPISHLTGENSVPLPYRCPELDEMKAERKAVR